MNTRHVVLSFDNSTITNPGTYSFRMDVPWPSIMKVRQIEAHNDGTVTGSFLLAGNWVPESGVIGTCHDGTSVAPQTSYYIPSALQGTYTLTVQNPDRSVFAGAIVIVVLLEFCPIEKDEKKSSS